MTIQRIGTPSVSLEQLLHGTRPSVRGQTDVTLADYVRELVVSVAQAYRRTDGITVVPAALLGP